LPRIAIAATLTDYVALGGILAALVLVAQNAALRQASPINLALYGFGLFAVFLFMPDAWTETYAFGRTLTPLLLLLLLVAISRRRWLPALPIAMVTPSNLLVYAAQIYHAADH
jgi:peptidoglycan/LPS O-acetylase OafA/YrhL